MSWNLQRALLSGVAVLLVASTAYAAMDATNAGWDPLVALFGAGDKARASVGMSAMNRAFGISIRNTRRDPAVQKFMDATVEDFADFDLGEFHDRLPNKVGDFRELWVRGELLGDAYVITQAKEKKGYTVTLKGDRNELAAMSTTVRAKPMTGVGDKSAYFIGLRMGFGIGDLHWGDAMKSLTGFARIGSIANPRSGATEPVAASAATKATVKKMHPKLSSEDVDVIALLWEAYPSVLAELSTFASVENVRTLTHGKGYQQLTVMMRGVPERIAQKYPAFAKYFEKMGDIALFDAKWLDKQGRTLTTTKVDTQNLTFQFSCFIKDGYLLPYKGVKVYEDEPVDPMLDTLTATKVLLDARVKLLGVVIKIKELKLDLFYQPNPHYAELGLTLTKVPEIKVEGAALGFVPTALVDAVIPGNIEGLARDFLSVTAKGIKGEGMLVAGKVGVGKEGSGHGVLELGVDFAALDNFLIKIGLGMVNERLVPNADALEEAKASSAALQTAFAKDFSRFEKYGAPTQ